MSVGGFTCADDSSRLRVVNAAITRQLTVDIVASPYLGQRLSYWIVICFSQDIRHGFRQIDMLWIPYLSDYLFWKFTYLVMVITWWYLTIFVHQVCLFTFRNSALIRNSVYYRKTRKGTHKLMHFLKSLGHEEKIIVLRQERHMPLNRSYLRLLL